MPRFQLLTLRDQVWNAALRFAYHPREDDPTFSVEDVCDAVKAEDVITVQKTLQSMAALGQLDAVREEPDAETRYCAPEGGGDGPNIPSPSPKSTDGEQFWRRRTR